MDSKNIAGVTFRKSDLEDYLVLSEKIRGLNTEKTAFETTLSRYERIRLLNTLDFSASSGIAVKYEIEETCYQIQNINTMIFKLTCQLNEVKARLPPDIDTLIKRFETTQPNHHHPSDK